MSGFCKEDVILTVQCTLPKIICHGWSGGNSICQAFVKRMSFLQCTLPKIICLGWSRGNGICQAFVQSMLFLQCTLPKIICHGWSRGNGIYVRLFYKACCSYGTLCLK